jgi:hypothetical protein
VDVEEQPHEADRARRGVRDRGLVILVAARHADTDRLAVMGLGVLLLVLGVGGLLAIARQTVVVDPVMRRITIEDRRFLRGTTTKAIPFHDVVEVGIGSLGKRSNYVMWYYLNLKLRTGEAYPLFAAGRFYQGGSDRATVEGWRRRLEEYLAQA